MNPYSEAAHEDHRETLKNTSTADHPRVSDEHHQTENVLNGRQIDTQHDSQLCFLQRNVCSI